MNKLKSVNRALGKREAFKQIIEICDQIKILDINGMEFQDDYYRGMYSALDIIRCWTVQEINKLGTES